VKRSVVVDASALAASLVDSGSDGVWASATLSNAHLAAPSLIEFEAANIFRGLERGGKISADQAAQAHADLVDMPIEYWPYELLAPSAWLHRHNLTIYDASYVALAELRGVTLVTLDRRLGRSPGLSCAVEHPQ
jgi:predicted nucleic acid-binding protein